MAMVARSTIPRIGERSRHRHPQILNRQDSAINHAVRLIHAVCGLAGSATWIDDIRADLRADKVQAAIRHRNIAVVFDWLMAALSYQGVSDAAAYEYMARHGRAEWRDIDQKLGQGVSCPKLKSYWHFHGCRYEKASRTCAEPEHIGDCPLPSHEPVAAFAWYRRQPTGNLLSPFMNAPAPTPGGQPTPFTCSRSSMTSSPR
jgi:hypothetical protein